MARDEKKRKRPSEGDDAPNKKASSGAAIKVRFPALRDELHPVIASSPGVNIPSTPFQTFAKAASSKKELLTTPAPSTHSLIMHSSSHPRLDYTAEQKSDPSRSHYTAVYDPQTSSLHILPAHPVTLRTTLRSETTEVRDQNTARSFAQQREDLGTEFGTKKAKKALASKYENAITSGADRNRQGAKPDAVEAAVLGSVQEALDALPPKEAMQDAVLAAKPIPQPNLAATEVENVYPLSVLVPPADMRNLAVKEWQDAAASNEDVKLTSKYVAKRMQPIATRDDVQRLKALKYLLLLLDFNAALKPGKGGKKVPIKDQLRAKMSAWPETLIDSVRRRFSQANELNKWHMDNLITHMAAITLYIDGYKTDTQDLRDDLHLENKAISQYFHELGCKVNPPTEKEQVEFKIPNKALAAQSRIAKLKLPLDFPKVRNPPRRR